MVEDEDLSCEEQVIKTRSDLRKDDDLLVFPPTNHENLYIDGFDKDRESSSTPSSSPSSYSSLSPFDSDGRYEFDRKPQCHQPLDTDGKSPPYDSGEKRLGWKLLLAQVLSNFQRMVTRLCSFSESLRSFYPVIVIVTWWWMRKRARRRLHGGEIEAHFRDTIKERDKRIVQLLHQIARMNELLIDKKHSN